VFQDVIEELCTVIGVAGGEMEMEEFSLYCIVEGDTFTMPLAREEYILDVTTELHKNQQVIPHLNFSDKFLVSFHILIQLLPHIRRLIFSINLCQWIFSYIC
jgi:hypothetical protein